MNRRFVTGSRTWLIAAAFALTMAAPVIAQTATKPVAGPQEFRTRQQASSEQQAAMDAAWEVLQMLRDYVHASQILEDPQSRAEQLAVARKELLSLVTHHPGVKREELETYVLQYWPPVVARYVEGYDRRSMAIASHDGQVVVTILAANPHDEQVVAETRARLTKQLQERGFAGDDLARRLEVRLKRELAKEGVGYPVDARIALVLRKVDGQWKATQLDIGPVEPFAAAGNVPKPVGRAATQPAR